MTEDRESHDEKTIRKLREALQNLLAALDDEDKEAIRAAIYAAKDVAEWPDW